MSTQLITTQLNTSEFASTISNIVEYSNKTNLKLNVETEYNNYISNPNTWHVTLLNIYYPTRKFFYNKDLVFTLFDDIKHSTVKECILKTLLIEIIAEYEPIYSNSDNIYNFSKCYDRISNLSECDELFRVLGLLTDAESGTTESGTTESGTTESGNITLDSLFYFIDSMNYHYLLQKVKDSITLNAIDLWREKGYNGKHAYSDIAETRLANLYAEHAMLLNKMEDFEKMQSMYKSVVDSMQSTDEIQEMERLYKIKVSDMSAYFYNRKIRLLEEIQMVTSML